MFRHECAHPTHTYTHTHTQTGWVDAPYPAHETATWDQLRLLRADVNKALEQARTAKLLGASLEASVYIHCEDAAFRATLEALRGDGKRAPCCCNCCCHCLHTMSSVVTRLTLDWRSQNVRMSDTLQNTPCAASLCARHCCKCKPTNVQIDSVLHAPYIFQL